MMKNTKVILAPLTMDAREQFILDNQWVLRLNEEFICRTITLKRTDYFCPCAYLPGFC